MVSYLGYEQKIIDPVAPRFTAVDAKNVVSVKLLNGPKEPYTESKPKHKKNPEVGNKRCHFADQVLIDQEDADLTEGEEVTFMDWGNIIVSKSTKKVILLNPLKLICIWKVISVRLPKRLHGWLTLRIKLKLTWLILII